MKRWIGVNGIWLKVGPKMYAWYMKHGDEAVHGKSPAKIRAALAKAMAVSPAVGVKARRARVVKWLRWGIAHEPQIHYTESAARSGWLAAFRKKATAPPLPLSTDCSGDVTLCYAWAGEPDPNGLAYGELGYTGTLWDHALKIGHVFEFGAEAIEPADLIIMGPKPGAHVVAALEHADAGKDFRVSSHGDEAGPVEIMLSVDPREPKTVLRFIR